MISGEAQLRKPALCAAAAPPLFYDPPTFAPSCHCLIRPVPPLRSAAVGAGTEVGKKAKALMAAGALVGDDIVIGIIKDRIQVRRRKQTPSTI